VKGGMEGGSQGEAEVGMAGDKEGGTEGGLQVEAERGGMEGGT